MAANNLYDNRRQPQQARIITNRSSNCLPFNGSFVVFGKSFIVCVYEGGLSTRIQEMVIEAKEIFSIYKCDWVKNDHIDRMCRATATIPEVPAIDVKYVA